MRQLLSSLLQHKTIVRIRHWWAVNTAPLQAAWHQYSAPLRRFAAPATDAWQRFTAPARARWAVYAAGHPRAAGVLSKIGTVVKYGLYFLLFLIFGVWIGLFGRIPSSEELRNIETANATEIYSSDGELLGKFYIENRTTIALENISPHVINALIATEDRRFFDHSGIDLISWLRVGFGIVTGRESGGGSTLSQQLAKNLYPRKKYWIPGVRLLINKIRENFISVKLERIYTKEQLLALYLNTVPFGGDIFGISVASKFYFGKKAKDLTPDQSAALIGMLKATTFYNPIRNPENAKRRRNIVLQQMLRNGHLSQSAYEALCRKAVGAKRHATGGNNEGSATYFREYLRTVEMRKILKKYPKEDGDPYNLYTDGLKIYTTVDSRMQRFAEESVAQHIRKLQDQFDTHWKNYKEDKPWGDDKWILEQVHRSERWETLKDAGLSDEAAIRDFETPVRMTIFSWKGAVGEIDTTMSPLDSVRYYFCLLNCGFMAMDHTNGQVKAWVGGTNFKHFKFDHIKSRRQVGSTFKPIVYSAAIASGVQPCDFFPNQMDTIGGDWVPRNSDGSYGGYYSVVGALAGSINVVAGQLIEKVGIQKTMDMAAAMGVSARLPREFGISLGAAEVSLYEMMQVYATIANKGVRPTPVMVLKVTTREGEVIYDAQDQPAKPNAPALTPDQAATMTLMLQNVIDHGTGARLKQGYGLYYDFAGKTGTTQNHSDGWFICFNPKLVAGAWVGGESPAVRFRSMSLGQGSAMALPIVGQFWHSLARDKKLSPILLERFPEASPEVRDQFGCPYYLDFSLDTLNLLMQDSVIRDSLSQHGFRNLRERFADFLNKLPPPANPEENPDGSPEGEKNRPFFFKLGSRQEEEEEEQQ
jgi:penicillin-binding protein 1A